MYDRQRIGDTVAKFGDLRQKFRKRWQEHGETKTGFLKTGFFLYGGRISSMLDIKVRQGNNNKIQGEGGVGLVTSNLLLDGPIVRDHSTLLVSGRITYSDWYLRYIPNSEISNNLAYFHDIIAKVSHKLNDRNNISLSGYTSHDSLSFPGDSIYGWSNYAVTLKWSKTLSQQE
ncbi:MAG: hypothetical protein KFF73_20525 [Cyclobacteriaceae bacterium]|nr:hypothetical protein [Cyclobacteriaceae bacterium]